MSWLEQNVRRLIPGRLVRLAAPFAIAALVGGCFQPMYGASSTAAGPGLQDALSSVEVTPIAAPNGTSEARLAVEVRNALNFDLNGGAGPSATTHKLVITMRSSRQSVIVDLTSARAEIENYGIDASYSLTEVATGKTVATGSTFARVSYDIPGQVQRYARLRGLRDAESRAGKEIADQIRTRLASYFVAGT